VSDPRARCPSRRARAEQRCAHRAFATAPSSALAPRRHSTRTRAHTLSAPCPRLVSPVSPLASTLPGPSHPRARRPSTCPDPPRSRNQARTRWPTLHIPRAAARSRRPRPSAPRKPTRTRRTCPQPPRATPWTCSRPPHPRAPPLGHRDRTSTDHVRRITPRARALHTRSMPALTPRHRPNFVIILFIRRHLTVRFEDTSQYGSPAVPGAHPKQPVLEASQPWSRLSIPVRPVPSPFT
jgi:hypothetical protein